jgi:hypothetical protein
MEQQAIRRLLPSCAESRLLQRHGELIQEQDVCFRTACHSPPLPLRQPNGAISEIPFLRMSHNYFRSFPSATRLMYSQTNSFYWDTKGKIKMLEIGCGNSQSLQYQGEHKQLNYEVWIYQKNKSKEPRDI